MDAKFAAEHERVLEAAPGIKYRAAMGVAYGAGVRVSEVAHLEIDDINSKRMLLRIEEGSLSDAKVDCGAYAEQGDGENQDFRLFVMYGRV